MKEHAMPSFAELNRTLSKTSSEINPAQIHGLICGILCGPQSDAVWNGFVDSRVDLIKNKESLKAIYTNTYKQLDDFLFDFQLLLPSDSKTLPLRAEALTLWCQGFLTGLKLSQINITDRSPSEVTEAINDLIEIAKINYEEVVESDEDEEAYTELVEYVRMAVILIYQDLKGSSEQSITFQ